MSMYEISAPRGYSNGRGYAQSGLGYAQVVAAILGPLVEGGASIYSTAAGAKTSKAELKQRKVEFAGQQELNKQALEAQQRQFSLAQRAAIQQAQIAQASAERNAPYIVAVVGLAVLGFISASALKPKKKKKKDK